MYFTTLCLLVNLVLSSQLMQRHASSENDNNSWQDESECSVSYRTFHNGPLHPERELIGALYHSKCKNLYIWSYGCGIKFHDIQ